MNLRFLITLSENDQRVLIAFIFAIVLLFVLIGLLGSLIVRTMKWQGKKCDTLVSDVVTNRIVTTPHQLRKYAAKKNARHFIKQAWIPIIIIAIGVGVLLIRNSIVKDWTYDPFNKDTGFGTLLFMWDFTNEEYYTTIFGMKLLAKWPALINQPHFVVEAIWCYVHISCLVVGGLWYIVAAQSYLARTIRSFTLSKTVFEKSLDGFDQNSPNPSETQK